MRRMALLVAMFAACSPPDDSGELTPDAGSSAGSATDAGSTPDGGQPPGTLANEGRCDDGQDDDGDELIDCADNDCDPGGAGTCAITAAPDPMRPTASVECSGPLADPATLGDFLPHGVGALELTPDDDRFGFWYRSKDCNTTTGCSPWNIVVTSTPSRYGWYALRMDPTGTIHFTERDRYVYKAAHDFAVTSAETTATLGVMIPGSGVVQTPMTVRMTNPTPTQLCISMAMHKVVTVSVGTRIDAWIGKTVVTKPLASTDPAAFAPLQCTGAQVDNATIVSWMPAGSTLVGATKNQERAERRHCHAQKGCRTDGTVYFESSFAVGVTNSGLAMRVHYSPAVFTPITAGAFAYDEPGDATHPPAELRGHLATGKCIESLWTSAWFDPWLYSDTTVAKSFLHTLN